jgi:hypothetical protein
MRSASSFASERIVSEITFPQRADGALADISLGSRKTEAMRRNLSGVRAKLVVKMCIEKRLNENSEFS